MPRIAILSLHTSPLAALGGSKAGGMNAYIREVASALGATGWDIDIFTRRDEPEPSPTYAERRWARAS